MPNLEKFARRCNITGKGMNEGYCILDGEMYIHTEEDMLKYLLENTEYKNLQEAYDDEYCYWTEWEVEDGDYFLEDGTEFQDGVEVTEGTSISTVKELREFLNKLPSSCDNLPIRLPSENGNNWLDSVEVHETGSSGYEESGEIYLMGPED
jgi:hypothetical protein